MKQLPPPKREPFFAPGAFWFLAEFVVVLAILMGVGEAWGWLLSVLL